MKKTRRVRYAVVGLGHIAQTAVLPAFAHARGNSELTALVSTDDRKLRAIARKYGAPLTFKLDELEACLSSGAVDAVYIATPNTDHQRIAEAAARNGVHVLCEKPLAATVEGCRAIRKAVRKSGVKAMVAYRLHFDRANLTVADIVRSGGIGEPRLFNSTFTFQIEDPENIRLKSGKGGGPLRDIGIYCINAARSAFGEEPVEVVAFAGTKPGDRRFREVPEMVSATLRFPEGKLATFICSFGAEAEAWYEIVGTEGGLCLENAYEYTEPMELTTWTADRERTRSYAKRDQFAPELVYFSDCILNDRRPEPSLEEGLNDVKIIEALEASIERAEAVPVRTVRKAARPTLKQELRRKPVRRAPKEIHATSPHS